MDNSSTFNWTTKNLDVDKFRNGDIIFEAKTDEEWELAGINGTPAWCYYDNDLDNGLKYGKIYNFYAVKDPRGLAPLGWHIPTDEEWTKLTEFLGFFPGKKLKSKNGWEEEGNGIDLIGFNAIPGGLRTYYGYFALIGQFFLFWSATMESDCEAWYRVLNYNNGNVDRDVNWMADGCYVRCLMD
jgi:uncharacterized protein (TIGR02145 family)